MARECLVDVRELPFEEGLTQARIALAALSSGDYLRLKHRREPIPLYALFEQQGLCYWVRPARQGCWDMFIWQCDDAEAVQGINALFPGAPL